MRGKKLLVIAQGFPDKTDKNYDGAFIKEQLSFIRKEFEEINVIVPTPAAPSFIKGMPFIPKTWKQFTERKNYSYYNVNVFFPRFFVLPLLKIGRNIGKTMAKKVTDTIEKNEIEFDLIHSHFTYPPGYAGNEVKKKYGRPHVITVHEDADWLKREVREEKCINSWRQADCIIRVNKKDIGSITGSGISGSKIRYIPNGFNHSFFRNMNREEARKRLGLPRERKIILNIGKLDHRKNQSLAINAMKDLTNKYDELLFLILGEGPMEKELSGLIASSGLEDFVRLVGGNKKREEIPLWINASDIFLLTSMSEGNPTVMFEAIGCNTPYVGSDVGGSSEIIENNDIGLLFRPDDLSDLIKKLSIAIKKEWNRDKIESHAKKYSWEAVCRDIVKVYRGLFR